MLRGDSWADGTKRLAWCEGRTTCPIRTTAGWHGEHLDRYGIMGSRYERATEFTLWSTWADTKVIRTKGKRSSLEQSSVLLPCYLYNNYNNDTYQCIRIWKLLKAPLLLGPRGGICLLPHLAQFFRAWIEMGFISQARAYSLAVALQSSMILSHIQAPPDLGWQREAGSICHLCCTGYCTCYQLFFLRDNIEK